MKNKISKKFKVLFLEFLEPGFLKDKLIPTSKNTQQIAIFYVRNLTNCRRCQVRSITNNHSL
jgi:hypothetical protein